MKVLAKAQNSEIGRFACKSSRANSARSDRAPLLNAPRRLHASGNSTACEPCARLSIRWCPRQRPKRPLQNARSPAGKAALVPRPVPFNVSSSASSRLKSCSCSRRLPGRSTRVGVGQGVAMGRVARMHPGAAHIGQAQSGDIAGAGVCSKTAACPNIGQTVDKSWGMRAAAECTWVIHTQPSAWQHNKCREAIYISCSTTQNINQPIG